MASNMSKFPGEIWDIVAQNMPFPDWIKFWSSDDSIRQRLNDGPAVVKVGRLLLLFYEN